MFECLTPLNRGAGDGFSETISLQKRATETRSDKFVRVWSQWSPTADHEPQLPTDQLPNLPEYDIVHERSPESSGVPLEFILVEELERFLAHIAPSVHSLLNPFKDPIQNQLIPKDIFSKNLSKFVNYPFLTGTVAMTVGRRIVVSPMCPRLILLDLSVMVRGEE